MGKFIRFYVDEHVPHAVVKGLRLHEVDVLTTAEANMLGASDEEQLAFATKQNRTLYTQDADFLRLHQRGVTHAGIVFAKQGHPIGEAIRGLLLIYHTRNADSIAGTVEFI